MRFILGTDKAVQHDEARQPLASASLFRHVQHTGEF